jgi:hypothetical protein
MTVARMVALALALAIASAGCAYMPGKNARLEEARTAHARALSAPEVAAFAPAEARRAVEALERALEAWNTLQDPALVDHLAYVARQRAEIAAAVAQRVAADRAACSELRQVSGRP